MDKEEILAKSRKENKNNDERELQVKDKSIAFSYIAMTVMAAVFTAIRAGQGLPMMDLCATVCGSVCAGMAYRFFKTKKTEHLVLVLITFIVMIVAIMGFIMGY